MARIVLTRATWRTVAHELAAAHTEVAPRGLLDRIAALLAQAPREWPDQAFALELDEASAEVVRAVHAALVGEERGAGQRAASVAEAMQIIRNHQQDG
jgi:hypothetical protein